MKPILTALLLAAVRSAAGQSGVQTWTIDPNHSAAEFAVKHMMVSTVRGQFEKISGTVQYDARDIKSLSANVTIDAASVNTRVENRDKDLRSVNFFDVDKYPTITFVSKRVQPIDPGHFKLIGDLTMHGVTKEVTLDVDGPSAAVKQGAMLRTGASATTKINRHDFNLNYSKMVEATPIVGDDITITLDIEATRRAP
ncbi:MAG TPA: YceI family protein [Gemmatimonadaceae bacterium]|jgi:polyisoprenoid-binding protein YceI|nr:YceI family protein [Gemmatimonadaceae bacterium]